MQLSAANLLIASQQLLRGASPNPAAAKAAFSETLTKETGASFEPMEFRKPAAPAASAASPSPTTSATSYGRAATLGSQLDIRV